MKQLHIHIVTRQRSELLSRCLDSVHTALAEHGLENSTIVTLLVNGADIKTTALLQNEKYAFVEATEVTEEHRSLARNRALGNPLGEILYFLDDDVIVPSFLFRDCLARFHADPSVSVVGGPNLTPPDSTPKEKLFGDAMACPWIAPLAWRRYEGQTETDNQESSFILCNLAVRVAHLSKSLLFEDGLRSNEENLFLHRLEQQGRRFLFDPALYVYHRRRATWWSFALQVASYGQGRAEQTWRAGKSLSLLHLAPALGCLYAGPLILMGQFKIVLVCGLPYCAFILLMDSFTNRKTGWKIRLLLIPAATVIQSAYGLGFWKGMVEGLCVRAVSALSSLNARLCSP